MARDNGLSAKTVLLTAALLVFGFALFLGFARDHGLRVPGTTLLALRWIALAALVGYAGAHRSLTAWILVAMLVGVEMGHDAPAFSVKLRFLSQIFLRLIRTIIAPLLFGTLVSGIAGHADLRKVGRLGFKALIYFELVTTAALFIGLVAINLSKAGVGVQPSSTLAEQVSAVKPAAMSPGDIILHAFPENIAQSVAEGQVLQVVVFSIIFAIAVGLLSEPKRRPMLRFAEGLTDAMFKFTNIVMLFAPVGVGAAVAYTIGHTGLGVLANLIKLLGTFYIALLALFLLVFLPVALLARIPWRAFVEAIVEPVSIAFATSSSEAALPSAMESMEAFGVPRPTVAFVIPTGYSFNLDGATLYLSLASIFVAQAAGLHLTVRQQLVMMLTLMLASKGVAGVSRGSLVVLLATLPSFGLPTEPALILLGVDQLMDMARTSVNVVGNCLAAAVIARWEGELSP
ncbi:MAG TPA: cation:dicarboxylase symporter family transporter [Terriglobia bacterium]|jgi:proton glutamate symport protein|nr:cation:dicarboxylase symporter family transporter [Terriglobia bacterium]